MQELVVFMAKSLVEHPDQVVVHETEGPEAIILSMTPAERAKPDIMNPSRKRRIAAGCGQRVEDVNRLLKQYRQMQDMMKQLKKMSKKGGRGFGGFPGMGGMPGMPGMMPPRGGRR